MTTNVWMSVKFFHDAVYDWQSSILIIRKTLEIIIKGKAYSIKKCY